MMKSLRERVVGHAALTASPAFGLELVDEVDDVEEAAAGTVTDAGPGDGDGEMGLAGAADEDDVALVSEERAAGEVTDQVSLIGVSANTKSSRSLASGSLAVVIWYLIERACFSAISAERRSPTMRCGSCWRLTAVVMISSKSAFMP